MKRGGGYFENIKAGLLRVGLETIPDTRPYKMEITYWSPKVTNQTYFVSELLRPSQN